MHSDNRQFQCICTVLLHLKQISCATSVHRSAAAPDAGKSLIPQPRRAKLAIDAQKRCDPAAPQKFLVMPSAVAPRLSKEGS